MISQTLHKKQKNIEQHEAQVYMLLCRLISSV